MCLYAVFTCRKHAVMDLRMHPFLCTFTVGASMSDAVHSSGYYCTYVGIIFVYLYIRTYVCSA